jgi:RNAse (barnase) inhibitor barstar
MDKDEGFTVSHLVKPAPPWILRLASEAIHPLETEWTLAEYGITARALNGAKMRTKGALFDEFASRLEFPSYFGHNWDALNECLADLSWLPGSAYTVVIGQASFLLDNEKQNEFETFLRVIGYVAEEWSGPVDVGEFWDRPETPFHLLFHEAPDNLPALRARLRQANVDIPDLAWGSVLNRPE